MKAEPETISVTELRANTRQVLENAHFRGRKYVIERAGQEMAVILGVEEYRRLVMLAQESVNATGSHRSMSDFR